MSTAAERRTDGNALHLEKARRRGGDRKRKSGRVSADWRSRRPRVVALALLGAVNLLLLLLVCGFAANALWPAKRAESMPAPLIVASATELRDEDKVGPPPAEPPPPMTGPVAQEEIEELPPPREEPVPPELLAVAPREAQEFKPKPENAPPRAAAAKPAAPDLSSTRQRKGPSELDLLKQLADAQEFGLTLTARQSMAGAYQTDYQLSRRMATRPDADASILLRHFPTAGQLPIRHAPGCQLRPNEAVTLGELAKKLHAYLDRIAPRDAKGKRGEPVRLRAVLKEERRGKRPEWLRAEAVPAMVQILMAEDVPLRLLLVELLSEIDGPAATIRLAQRAVFDHSPQVRDAAIVALYDRPREQALTIFVNAFRYPWPPAADHAAEALAALGDTDAAPLLVAQLGKPDPALPYAASAGRTMVRDLVRINHVANCLICHAPALSGRDPVVGIDPITIRPPSTLEDPRYGRISNPRRQGIWANNVLIRADVQFLRQDFSVTFPFKQVFGSLQGQRFDYVVRTRPLKGEELRDWKKQATARSATYPQRESALVALRALTGQDAGPSTEAWLKLYPDANAEAEGLRISEALVKAAYDQRDRLLARYRDAKEEIYTEGLACAIPHLGGKLQEKVRAALVVRLARMSAEQIRERLQDDDEELRHAAALACIRKADRQSIPDLIELLLDEDPTIGNGARKALQILTDEDFGAAADASPEERAAAVARWHAWLSAQDEP